MQRSIFLLMLGAVLMVIVIAYGFVVGNLLEEAKVLFPSPWFQVALIDLYLGFAIFSGWIIYREKTRARAIVWIVLLCLLGNLASCIYAAMALVACKGDMERFWSGYRAVKA